MNNVSTKFFFSLLIHSENFLPTHTNDYNFSLFYPSIMLFLARCHRTCLYYLCECLNLDTFHRYTSLPSPFFEQIFKLILWRWYFYIYFITFSFSINHLLCCFELRFFDKFFCSFILLLMFDQSRGNVKCIFLAVTMKSDDVDMSRTFANDGNCFFFSSSSVYSFWWKFCCVYKCGLVLPFHQENYDFRSMQSTFMLIFPSLILFILTICR